jgi:hypothetical protein
VTWKRGDRHLRAVRASPPPLTDRFLAAVALACETHGDQRRLGTEIPYAGDTPSRAAMSSSSSAI